MRFPLGRRFLRALAPLNPMPRGVERGPGEWGGVSGISLRPHVADAGPRVLYLHGGAYCFGSPATHASFVARLASACEVCAFAASYRLAPEHPYPAALDDARAAYLAIAARHKPPVLVGDSAGGGLALSLAIACRDEGLPPPAGVALISPWVDLTCGGESIRINAGRDAMLRPQYLDRCASAYAGRFDRSDPRVSPLFADLSGLPAVVVHVAGQELFLSEGVGIAARLRDAGVDVEAKLYKGMWHDFHIHAGMMKRADEAVTDLAGWIRERLAQPASA